MRTRLWVCAVLSCLALAAVTPAHEAAKAEYLNSGKVLSKTLPFSEAVRVGNLLYLSG